MYDTSPDSMGSLAQATMTPFKSTRNQKRFIFPKPSKMDKAEAYERLDEAMLQEPDRVHFNRKGNGKSATLSIEILKFNASGDDDIWNTLNEEFQKVLVEDPTVPRRNGKSMGYRIVLSRYLGLTIHDLDETQSNFQNWPCNHQLAPYIFS